LIWLQARENCLNANQQWMVCALLKQMGYQMTIVDPHEVEKRPRDIQLQKALREVKQHARNADYCDFSEGISQECLTVYDAIKNKNASTDTDTAARLSNQMKCLQKGLSAGLNPQETNDIVTKVEKIKELVDSKLLLPQDDDNQLIANYLDQYGELIAFRKRVQRISATGAHVTETTFTEAIKRDIMDRGNIGTANKTISPTELNAQLLAIRTSAKIDVTKLPTGEFNATEHFNDVLEDLKAQKCRTGFEVIRKALAILGYASMSCEKTRKINGKTNNYKQFVIAVLP